jgi:long-subunit fatty acid transport protein
MTKQSPRFVAMFVLVGALMGALLLLAPHTARAAGFEYPVQGTHALGRGGAFTVAADDPSAMYWNPSRLSLLRGTRLLYNHSFVKRDLTYHRAPQLHGGEWVFWDPAEDETGFFNLGVSLFITSDFGLDDWTFGLGFVGPSAIGTSDMPGEVAAGNRNTFISKDILMAYYTASVAWKYEEWFGIGVSLQYVDLMSMKYSLVIEGPDSTGGHPKKNLWDIRNTLDMADRVGFSALVGAWARPLPWLELGLSARVVPIAIDAEGTIHLEGTDNSVLSEATPERVGGAVHFTIPATVQVGARYVHRAGAREVFDVEVDFVWEQWSVLDAYDVEFDEAGVLFEDPDDPSRVLLEIRPQDFALRRQYQDTYSVRVGGQWNVWPEHLWLRAGGLWESAAVPKGYTLTDFASYDRFGLAFGLSGAWRGIELSFAYAHIFQLPRNVYPDEARVNAIRMNPDFSGEIIDGPVANAGRYDSSYDVISIGLSIHFDALISGDE